MKEKEMQQVGDMILQTLERVDDTEFHKQTLKKVRELCEQFPLNYQLTGNCQ